MTVRRAAAVALLAGAGAVAVTWRMQLDAARVEAHFYRNYAALRPFALRLPPVRILAQRTALRARRRTRS